MNRRVWILAAVTIAGSWALLSLRRSPPPATSDDGQQQREPLPESEQQPTPSAEIVVADSRQPAAPEPPKPQPPNTPPPAEPEPLPAAEARPKPNPLAPEHSGPIAELTEQFDREPRPSHANETEAAIRAQFSPPEAQLGVLADVMCKTAVCKLELRWTEITADAYMAGVMRAYYALEFHRMASDPSDTPEADGSVRVTMYFANPSDSEP